MPEIRLRFVLGPHESNWKDKDYLPLVGQELLKGDIVCLECVGSKEARSYLESYWNEVSRMDTTKERRMIFDPGDAFYARLANEYFLGSGKVFRVIDAEEKENAYESFQKNIDDLLLLDIDLEQALVYYHRFLALVVSDIKDRERLVIEQIRKIIGDLPQELSNKEAVTIVIFEGAIHTGVSLYFKGCLNNVERIFLSIPLKRRRFLVEYPLANIIMRKRLFEPAEIISESFYKRGVMSVVLCYVLQHQFEDAGEYEKILNTFWILIASRLVRLLEEDDMARIFNGARVFGKYKPDFEDERLWQFNLVRWEILFNDVFKERGIFLPSSFDDDWLEKLETI